jgi:LacI family transcriptional regulator
MASAAALGYVPNPHARALAANTSDTVGLVIHDVRDPYFSLIAGGAIDVATARGQFVTMACTYRDPDLEAKYIATLRAQRVRAIILAGSAFVDAATSEALTAELTSYYNAGGSVVSITRHRLPGDSLVVGNRSGAADLARRLVDLGHTEFALLSGSSRLVTIRDRIAGFKKGLAESGIQVDPRMQFSGSFDHEGGLRATQELLAGRRLPTCIFASNDVMALGALTALRRAGVDVPGQISVAGFGDVVMARDFVPTLSTVHLPLEEMGAQAMELALREDRGPTARRVTINGEVVLRESTGSPRSGRSR